MMAVPATQRDARARQFAVRLLFLIFVLFLAEGVLRKWVLPQLAAPLFFLRDPLVIVLYGHCLANGLVLRNKWLRVWLLFALATIMLGGLAFMQEANMLAWLLGARTYWLYMPMAFVVPACLTIEDVQRFSRLVLWFAIPYACLIFFQFLTGPAHWINWSIAGDEGLAMTGRFVRPYGVFTYTGQNVLFSGILFGLLLAVLVAEKPKPLAAPLLVVVGGAVLLITLLTGSRGIYFMMAGSLLGAVAAAAIAGSARVRGRIVAGIVLAGLAMPLVVASPVGDGLRASLERERHAMEWYGEPTLVRATAGALSFLDGLDAPLFGLGIGAGTSSVARLLPFGQQLTMAESELERVNLEVGPVLGLTFAALRVAFALWLVVIAFRAARSGSVAALPLLGAVIMLLQHGQLTFSSLNAYMIWSTIGLVILLATAAPPPTQAVRRVRPMLRRR